MGEDPRLESRMETVAQRVEFIELLADEGPLPPRDILAALPHSRATVTRALRELREANLVQKREGGYDTVVPGLLAAEQYRRYQRSSEAVLSADHLLASIPAEHAPDVEVLVDAETILAEGDIPVRALETVSERVQRAERIRLYLPTLVNTHLLRVWHRAVLATNVDTMALFDPDLLTVLKGQYPHLLAEMAGTSGFSAYSTAGPPYGIVRTTTNGDSSVAIIVYEDETVVRGVLTNETPASVEWADTRLDALRSEAADVTSELAALSDAVADGVRTVSGREANVVQPERTADIEPSKPRGHSLPLELEGEGFVRLSESYFDTHSQAPPAVSWRTGFTLTEVHDGHALDRLDAEGSELTDLVVESLRDGNDSVLLGPPGSGKSTACMAAACEWYDRGFGPVLYRERGDGDRFDSPALLEAYLRQADEHALVVVEDAVRDEANAIFKVIQSLDGDPAVSFLLDARTHEWRNPGAFTIDARRDAHRRAAVDEIPIPKLDRDECQRFVEHFRDLVGADVDLSGPELFAKIEQGTSSVGNDGLPAGDALIAQHYLAQEHESPVEVDASLETALDEAVRQTYRSLTTAEHPLAPELGLTIATLTAAGIPVASEYLYGVVESDQYGAVDEVIPFLTGRLLFEQDQSLAESSTTYRTRHETWAVRFLEAIRDMESAARSRERFGRIVTRLLGLANDPERRDHIQRHLGGQTPHLHRIEADPGEWADEIAERIFGIAQSNADLAPLFGETTDDGIELTEACSASTRIAQAYWRGEMNRINGNLARAEREYRTLQELADEVDFPDSSIRAAPVEPGPDSGVEEPIHRTWWRGLSRTNLGLVARDRGEYETAEAYHSEALASFREIDEPEGEAITLKNLGAIAYLQSDYESAREYFDESLEIATEHDARRIAARCLNNLGTVTYDQNEYDRSREYHGRSLEIKRELGDLQGEANSLDNLGLVLVRQGEYEEARTHHERSLDIKRELGDRKGEATSLNNLGRVARQRGEDDRARDYFERSIDLRRELGDSRGLAHSLADMGELARTRGDYDRAREYLAEARQTFEEVGTEYGLARSQLITGRLAFAQEDMESARDRTQRARTSFQEIGSDYWAARSLLLLGRIAAGTDDHAEAREHWRAALETFQHVEVTPDALATLRSLVESCVDEGDQELARKWCRRAKQMLEGAPAPTAEDHREWIQRHCDGLGEA